MLKEGNIIIGLLVMILITMLVTSWIDISQNKVMIYQMIQVQTELMNLVDIFEEVFKP